MYVLVKLKGCIYVQDNVSPATLSCVQLTSFFFVFLFCFFVFFLLTLTTSLLSDTYIVETVES